ncbi:hypothetical protein BAX97_16085 [Elizabethkingia meningoseptica]|nr:hypothetical protein BBD33_07690 [Elizabethkingia meningoseptica]AQX47179.1 hypothetical protein B5G46_07680 [Elizabethkingia meningoseptica]KUY17846.1 hypothetical protein ATB99_06215 [Elizabethkingia meningoseptica]OPB68464.1 hypothetical protein BAY30_08350 [Elizabethkingia meningoseptica]OPC29338.1 hypothetical protein BAX97_16085 [Elizabethkingia meningoseptica]
MIMMKKNNKTHPILGAILLFCFGILFLSARRRFSRNFVKKRLDREVKIDFLVPYIEESRFTYLIMLAKRNNPEFLILFKELYPQFISGLKKLDPKIKSSQLSFCAMAYLNFSSKDISEYTFVTLRAVQIRKNRLRKKYNIPSDEDFNSWMRRLGE